MGTHQFRKRTAKVPENRLETCLPEPPAFRPIFAGRPRPICKVAGGLTSSPQVLWFTNFLMPSLNLYRNYIFGCRLDKAAWKSPQKVRCQAAHLALAKFSPKSSLPSTQYPGPPPAVLLQKRQKCNFVSKILKTRAKP